MSAPCNSNLNKAKKEGWRKKKKKRTSYLSYISHLQTDIELVALSLGEPMQQACITKSFWNYKISPKECESTIDPK